MEVIIIVQMRNKVAHLEMTVEWGAVSKVRYVERTSSSIQPEGFDFGEGEKGENQHLAIMQESLFGHKQFPRINSFKI